MIRLYCLILFFVAPLTLFSQTYGNEWISFGGPGKYYSFKIYTSGIHRIDYNTLVNAGVPVASLNPKNFQIFGREKEQYIHVEGEQDNSFDPGDYIEFYAEKNDGRSDSLLYVGGTAAMQDTYYSLYNDTINYYFTWNNSTSNRRMIIDTDTNYVPYTSQLWFWTKQFLKSTTFYVQGALLSGGSISHFTSGEGWTGGFFNALSNTIVDVPVPTANAYTGIGAPDAKALPVIIGTSNATFTGTGNHHTRIYYGSSNTLVYDTIYIGYTMLKLPIQIPATAIGATTNIRYQGVNDQGADSDYQSVGSTTIEYAHNMNLGSATKFWLEVPFNNLENKSRLDLVNPSSSSFLFYQLSDTVRRIEHAVNGLAYPVLVPNRSNGFNNKCFVIDPAAIVNVNTLSPVNGTGDFTDYVALALNDAYLIITHASLMSGANQYAAYRSSPSGGAYNTLVVDVEELYHQYGTGVQKHAISIRRFLDDVYNNWPNHPQYLFLVGKSIREATESSNGFYPGTRQADTVYAKSLVPSFGYPSSDILLSAGIDTSFLDPAIPTGRLAALNNSEITNYLNKMMQYESLQDSNSVYTINDKDWMKHIMHFGGGSTDDEQNELASYLFQYENIIEDNFFGGYVHTFLKQTSDPINPVEYDEVMDRINAGVSLITFFGHSSVNGFDQNIDEPQNWNNNGKYPLLISNGCYSGDIHQPDPVSASEKFVKQVNKGVIGFLSSVKLGYKGTLHLYNYELYRQLSLFNYGATVGKLMQNTIRQVQPQLNDLSNIALVATCTQVNLHGDPALRINYHVKPELAIRPQDVFYNPSTITLADDSVDVNFVVTNLGKSVTDTLLVEVHRRFPNNADSLYTTQLVGIDYIDTITFRMPVQFNIGTGINIFDFFIDIPSFVPEVYDELNNNQVTSPLFIYSNGIKPVYPYEFAIVPDSIITLKASTYNPLISPKTYRFEIDTTDLFNSPEHRYQLVTSGGGVVQADYNNWLFASNNATAPLVFPDSTVYFWRVSPDSSVYVWHESSFQYIRNLTGWGQAHYFQYKDNYHETMVYDRPNRNWRWDPNVRRIGCEVYGSASTTAEINGTFWSLDGISQDYGGCLFDPAIHVAVIDPITMQPWGTYGCDPALGGACPSTCVMLNADHQFGSLNDGCACRGRVEYYFNFRQNTAVEMDSLLSMINNHVPNGAYILLYTWRYADYTNWTPSHYAMMSSLGADSIVSGRNNEPWIILARKGDPTFTKQVIGTSINSYISLTDSLFGYDYIGSMVSPQIGPSSEWQSLYWQQHSIETVSEDSVRISLYGIDVNGNETLLLDTLYTSLDSIVNLQGIVNASVYPKVKLKAWCKDTSYFSPAVFDRWQLVYTPVPEAAVNGNLGFYFSALSDSLEEGQEFNVAIAVQNISEYDMDSLLVHYWIEDVNRVRNYLPYPRQDSLRAGEILRDTVTFVSTGYPGLNSLWMEVNPVPLTGGINYYDQSEQFHFNNFAQIPFYVKADITNPILDVTFDGMHILNGDIVSGKPFIVTSLNDENEFLVMNQESDTAFFSVYLTDPTGMQKRIYFREGVNQVMQWYPSSGPQGKFKIEYNPTLPLDGRYTLLIQATDKSGNKSGSIDYKIQFEVINKPSITEVLNYPNPFSTKTHFVFTLTGNQIPDIFKIQIMTISGKVVKEIQKEEIGTIRIGRNITDYYWDGRDMYGDQLANGIYLYRVVARMNGTEMEKRESGADQYITKGFGKMYLMR